MTPKLPLAAQNQLTSVFMGTTRKEFRQQAMQVAKKRNLQIIPLKAYESVDPQDVFADLQLPGRRPGAGPIIALSLDRNGVRSQLQDEEYRGVVKYFLGPDAIARAVDSVMGAYPGNFGNKGLKPNVGGLLDREDVELRRPEVGQILHQYHLGQSDPIYMVGSYYVSGKEYPDVDILAEAFDKLESISEKSEMYGLDDEAKEQLGDALLHLEHELHFAGHPEYQRNGSRGPRRGSPPPPPPPRRVVPAGLRARRGTLEDARAMRHTAADSEVSRRHHFAVNQYDSPRPRRRR